MNPDREASISAAFVSIADSLVDADEVVDMLAGLTADCARLLAVDSAGVLLADPNGMLQVAAASSERTRLMELYQVQSGQGPGLDCYRGRAAVLAPDLCQDTARWPDFATVAVQAGYACVHAVPIGRRGTPLGTLGLFGVTPGPLEQTDLDLAQALAHVAGIVLTVSRTSADQARTNAQLQTALDSRVIIEQAKGILSQQGDLDMEGAFAVMRRYARDHNLRLSDLAASLIARQIPGARQVLDHARSRTTVAHRGGNRR